MKKKELTTQQKERANQMIQAIKESLDLKKAQEEEEKRTGEYVCHCDICDGRV